MSTTIIVTSEGIQIGDIVLRTTDDISAFLSAHQPDPLVVNIGANQPYELTILLKWLQNYDCTDILAVFK